MRGSSRTSAAALAAACLAASSASAQEAAQLSELTRISAAGPVLLSSVPAESGMKLIGDAGAGPFDLGVSAPEAIDADGDPRPGERRIVYSLCAGGGSSGRPFDGHDLSVRRACGVFRRDGDAAPVRLTRGSRTRSDLFPTVFGRRVAFVRVRREGAVLRVPGRRVPLGRGAIPLGVDLGRGIVAWATARAARDRGLVTRVWSLRLSGGAPRLLAERRQPAPDPVTGVPEYATVLVPPVVSGRQVLWAERGRAVAVHRHDTASGRTATTALPTDSGPPAVSLAVAGGVLYGMRGWAGAVDECTYGHGEPPFCSIERLPG